KILDPKSSILNLPSAAAFVLPPAAARTRSVARNCPDTTAVLRFGLEQAKHYQCQPDQYCYRRLRVRIAMKSKEHKAGLIAPGRGLSFELQARHFCPRHHSADSQREDHSVPDRKRSHLRYHRVGSSHDHKRRKHWQAACQQVHSQTIRLQLPVHHKLNQSGFWSEGY